jgi:hypothetical protein
MKAALERYGIYGGFYKKFANLKYKITGTACFKTRQRI